MVNSDSTVNDEGVLLGWVMSWIDTPCQDVPLHKKWYKFICFMAGRRKKKLTYKEIYIILCNINKKDGEEQKEVQRSAIKQIINIYTYNREHEDDKGGLS